MQLPKIRSNLLKFKLKEDRAILIICIGIALVFWLLVKLSQSYTTVKDVKLNFSVPESKTFVNAPPANVNAELEGQGWDLLFDIFSSKKIDLQYDLTQMEALDLSRSKLRADIQEGLRSGIRVIEVNYDEINLNLEEKISKTVPLVLHSRIVLDPEYHLRDSLILQPDSVVLTGPVSQITEIDHWDTDSLVLTNLRSSQTRMVSLNYAPPEISLNVRQAEVTVPVEQYTEKSMFVPLTVRNLPAGDSLKIFPQRIKVSCVVGLSQYGEVESEDFTLEIDLQGVTINEEKNLLPIMLTRQPEFVNKVNFTPKTAEFFIIKKEE